MSEYRATLREAEAALRARARALAVGGRFTRYADDPVGFGRDILGLHVWSRQEAVMKAARDHQRTGVRAGRKVSKSTSIAALALWNAMSRGQPSFLTSSSYAQLKDIIWREVDRLAVAARLPVTVPLDPSTGIRTPSGGIIIGRSTNKRENMQGYSGHDALYLADESSGLPREIVEALEGNLAGGGRLMLFGNPTQLSGPFYDAFHSQSSMWHGIRISSRESPNVTGEASIPGLATAEWIQQMEVMHGPDSAMVQVHVDGDFPASGSNTVISLALVEEAMSRQANLDPSERLHVGVDVARFGSDQTTVRPRRGNVALPSRKMRDTDSHAVARLVMEVVAQHATPDERPLVKVDVIGIGAGAYDVLRNDYGRQVEVLPVNVAESATAQPHEGGYRRLRDQLWFGMRDWLMEGGTLPMDEETRSDLIAATFRFDAQGRYVVSDKDELRKLIGRSPDEADALALSIYMPPLERKPDARATLGALRAVAGRR